MPAVGISCKCIIGETVKNLSTLDMTSSKESENGVCIPLLEIILLISLINGVSPKL